MLAEVGWFLHGSCSELLCDFYFFVELAQKHALKIILLLAAELELSFFSDNQQRTMMGMSLDPIPVP